MEASELLGVLPGLVFGLLVAFAGWKFASLFMKPKKPNH